MLPFKRRIYWNLPKHRWPIFGCVVAILGGVLAFFTGLDVSWFIFLPFLIYIGGATGFNYTEVSMDEKRLSWRERPFPLKRQRKLKRDEISGWRYGPMPKSRKGSSVPRYGVGPLRTKGKLMVVHGQFDTSSEAATVASELAVVWNLEAKARPQMSNPPSAAS